MNKKEQAFLDTVWAHYNAHARTMPWREPGSDGVYNPYKILVSEIMLQQTQVDRVLPKFHEFISRFPTIKELANAPLGEVITLWSGLGYNRRAKYLHDIAKALNDKPFPNTIEGLIGFKGIGENTAAAILTYAFNKPVVFIETNIRTVYIHHFFPRSVAVKDNDLRLVIERTLDINNPREFMWAVMDYGSFLKKQGIKAHAKSFHYTKQPQFKGSLRQLRGEVLRKAQISIKVSQLYEEIADDRLGNVMKALQKDGLIKVDKNRVMLP